MEDGVNGVPTRLVHEHVEEEYSGGHELVQIHVLKMEARIVKENQEDFPESATESLVHLVPKITDFSNAKLMTLPIQFTTGAETHVACTADKDS